MDLNIHFAKDIDPVAMVALLLSIIGGIFSFYTWLTSGARMSLTVSPNIIFVGEGFNRESKYISFQVTNTGDRPFTIIGAYGESWRSRIDRILGCKPLSIVINCNSYTGKINLPHKLDVGEQWSGFIIQNDKVEELLQLYSFMGVKCSFSKKIKLVRIKLPDLRRRA